MRPRSLPSPSPGTPQAPTEYKPAVPGPALILCTNESVGVDVSTELIKNVMHND